MARAFGRDVARHHQFDFVTQRRAQHRVGDAGIARSRIEDDFIGRQSAAFEAALHHIKSGAIFDAARRIHVFGFGIDLDMTQMAGDVVEAN